MASCCECFKRKETFCQKVVVKGNDTVKCRRAGKHHIVMDSSIKPEAILNYFQKNSSIILCEFHYVQFIEEQEKFRNKFIGKHRRTNVSIDLSRSHDE